MDRNGKYIWIEDVTGEFAGGYLISEILWYDTMPLESSSNAPSGGHSTFNVPMD
jgi:hypothetical protein